MKTILKKYKEFLEARKQSMVYYNYMRIFLNYLQKHKIEMNNITQETITKFFNHKKYSTNSLNNFVKAGRSFYKFLEITDENNQWFKLKLLKAERKIPNYLTEEDLKEAIKYLVTYHSNIMPSVKINALLSFMFYCGLRKGEILNVKRIDFNLKECSVKVCVPTKGKKERIVYYPEMIRPLLKGYFNFEEEKINAFNITFGQINYLARKIQKYFPNKKITIHLFRHSYARDMISKGIPLGVVSKLLGHSSINTTMIYTDPDEDMIKNMYKEKMK